MTITVPEAYVRVPDITLGRQIRGSEWIGLLRNQNWLYELHGATTSSYVWDPYWETSSVFFLRSGVVEPVLHRYQPLWTPSSRLLNDSGDGLSLWVSAYISGLELEIGFYEVDGNTVIGTTSISDGGDFPPQWVTQEIRFESGTDPDPIMFRFRARYDNSGSAAQGRLYQISIHESRLIDDGDLSTR